ncbi:MAG: hypothetical protein LBI57_07840, partial [Helicobacteraceae bacterium]|jgi:hypothetical protein|nr:hypothetical protein [Helicobacteraceae bacterium]
LQLNFCLNIPLIDLKNDSLNYLKDYCKLFEIKKSFSSIEYFNLIDSFFYLIATGYTYDNINEQCAFCLEYLNKKVRIGKNEFKNSSKIYLLLLYQYFLKKELIDISIIYKNKKCLGEFYNGFEGIADKNYLTLYNVIATELINANRMKRIYLNAKNKPKGIGYQNFSSIFSTLGKIEFWRRIGIELDMDIVNKKFVIEFEKEFSYFKF